MNEKPVIQCEFEFVAPRGTGNQKKSATVELVYSDSEDKRDNWADLYEESCELNKQF